MASEEIEVIEIGQWKTGFARDIDKVVMIFDFADREPIGFAMDPKTAGELGRALANLAPGEGRSTPAQAN